MVQAQDTARKRMAGRSPSYPGIGLEDALEKAGAIYEKEGKHPTPISTIVQHLGYRSESGPALVAVAALKKFGLLVDEGSREGRRARLSEDALRILLDTREDTSERQRLLQEAALKPAIHRELWEKYEGELPSDGNLRHELIFKYGFTENAVRDFIRQFRETLEFTGLTGSGKLVRQRDDKSDTRERDSMPPAPPAPPPPPADPPVSAGREIIIPISLDEWATLRAPFPLSEAKWKQMLAVLDAMKPALVGSSESTLRAMYPSARSDQTGTGYDEDEE